uniref:protein kinase family protein n=1 Tax=Allosalinactinospora lopnorensis TaxID=1352348 RepID=UPI000A5AEA90
MIEPGARLAGRYRLEEPVSDTGGATFWKATDETLARPVAVWTFADGFPRTTEVVHASRATSRVSDSRVTQVFDADDSGPTPYVVEEWVVGQSLAELLAKGPLEPERAAGLVAEAAEALSAANATGLFHLYLTPNKLMWSVGGAVKVTGVGVDAALRGVSAPDPAAADAQGLGKLLYAALTGHWPDSEQSGLPAAPTDSGRPCRPSQVRSGIPPKLDEIVNRAVFRDTGNQAPLASSREVAEALADVPRMVPLPATPANAPPPEHGTSRRSGEFGIVTPPRPPSPPRPQESHPPKKSEKGAARSPGLRQALIGAAALVLFVGVVAGAWVVGSNIGGGGGDSDGTGADGTGNQEAAVEPDEDLDTLEPQNTESFDPGGSGEEHNDRIPNAFDGDASTHWNTQRYNSAEFGNLKEGVGILVDLGEPAELHEVDLNLGNAGPANLEILVGDEPEPGALATSGEAEQASGETNVKLADPVEGQYVVIWFTQLPDEGEHRGTIHEVELRGKM